MTINDQHRATTGSDEADQAFEPLTGTHALVDRLHSGEPYAVAFGGQGGPWLENLEELVNSAGIESEISQLVAEAELLLEPCAPDGLHGFAGLQHRALLLRPPAAHEARRAVGGIDQNVEVSIT